MSGNGYNSYQRFLPFLRRDPETAQLIGGTNARQQAHSGGAGGSSGVPMSRRGEEPGLPLSMSSTSLTMPQATGAHSSHANGFWHSGQKSLLELKRFASPKGTWYIYWADMYHTMLNMPRYRFIVVFFATYVLLYILFALLYLTQPDHCVGGTMAFSHALWFSVQTAATLGYTSQLAPNIDCTAINILVLLEVIAASLLDYCMMGIVFARFATPVNRAQTIRFSKQAVLCKQESGFWGLSFRMANIRKHSLLQPELSLLLAVPDNTNASAFQFVALEIDNLTTQVANLKLGLPATVTHIIRPSSPLFELSLDEMQQRSIHIVCFMDGIDPMTSNSIQSRYSYMPSDIRMNERFTTIGLQQKGGKLGLDLTNFDGTVAAAFHAGMDGDDPDSYLYPVPEPSTTTPETMRDHMATLRSKSIRTLTAVGAGSIEALPLMASRDRDAALGVLCDAVLTDSLASSELRRTAASIKEQLAVMS